MQQIRIRRRIKRRTIGNQINEATLRKQLVEEEEDKVEEKDKVEKEEEEESYRQKR